VALLQRILPSSIAGAIACLTLAALALLTPSAAAGAPGPPKVSVRVEGASNTLLPETVVQTTDATTLRGHPCSGSSAAAALEIAIRGKWSGSFSQSLGDFFITTILGETPSGSNYWTLWVNARSSTTGACGTHLHKGDRELWFDCQSGPPPAFGCTNDPLAIKAPARVRRGHRVSVLVTQLDSGGHGTPIGGATVNAQGISATSDASGNASFVPHKAGTFQLQAVKTGATPSDQTMLCVYAHRASQCGHKTHRIHAIASATPTAPPRVQLLVVGRTSNVVAQHAVRAAATAIQVGKRRCAVPPATPLAALLAAKLPVRVTDRAGCDPASMFVTRVGGQSNRGRAGWEYKVGRKAPSLGAGSPGERLHSGEQLLWFWCVSANACQQTLAASIVGVQSGALVVHVLGFDDNGRGTPVPDATVHVGDLTALTDATGSATVPVTPGHYQVYASKTGLVTSFATEVSVAT
jgi:hypothetical protein